MPIIYFPSHDCTIVDWLVRRIGDKVVATRNSRWQGSRDGVRMSSPDFWPDDGDPADIARDAEEAWQEACHTGCTKRNDSILPGRGIVGQWRITHAGWEVR